MPHLALLLAAASFSLWIALAFFRGEFWRLERFDDDRAPHPRPAAWPAVAIVLPARNEAETIERVLRSLVGQAYPGTCRTVVVDDHSSDGTAQRARHGAAEIGKTSAVTVLEAAALDSGWTGKLWALQEGVREAEKNAPEYYWFTDADIVHAPDTLERLVSRAETHPLDLVSLMVQLEARSFAERLLIPPFLFFFLKLYPPRWTADRNARTAGAAGGSILLRRSALERIGGFAAIRGEVIDDCALARAVKQSGGAIWMGLTRRSVSLRAYGTFGEIADLIARTAFTQLGYSLWLLLGTVAAMLITYLWPVAALFCLHSWAWSFGLGAWALMTLTYQPTVRFYKLSVLWALALPLAAAFYTYATLLSAVRYYQGRGGQWKGRAQARLRSQKSKDGEA